MRPFAVGLLAWSLWSGWNLTAGRADPPESSATASHDPKSVEYFEKYIRPVLVEKCYQCHSAEHEISGGLSLESRAAWERGGDSGAAIEPGQPDKSRLIVALEYANKQLQMPPDGKLPDGVIDRFRTWIEAGAIDPREHSTSAPVTTTALPLEHAQRHWAYRPIVSSQPPRFQGSMVESNSIDSWLAVKMHEQGLVPAEKASDEQLVRRLYFDLHGLPPNEEQLTQYLSSSDPLRYTRLVDQLLASPRFGERMARRWMDVARYAESVTLRGFVLPQAWRYRDYLIRAFNEDRSLATMIMEQLAGDLMPLTASDSPTTGADRMVATTFLAMGNTNLEEQDKTQLEMDYIDEQLEVIGKAFLGQTISCARCHDHKFDPIPTRDYYALAGIFRSTRAMEHENVSKWIERPLPLMGQATVHYEQLNAELGELKKRAAKLEKLIKSAGSQAAPTAIGLEMLAGIVVDDSRADKVGVWIESNWGKPYVGMGYVHDDHAAVGEKTITFQPKEVPPGSYRVRLAYTPAANRSTHTIVRIFSADGEKQISVNQQIEPPIDQLWFDLGEYRFEKDGQAYVMISNENANGHVIADAVQFLPNPVASNPVASNPVASVTAGRGTAAETATAAEPQSELDGIKARLAQVEAELAARPKYLGIEEQLPAQDIPVHIRGSVHNLGSVVPRGFLQLARLQPEPQLSAHASGRLELAQWLVDPRHPLTARVMANRLWSWIFGEGLVRTVDNFGTTGEAPLIPELLDQLAGHLIQNNWSVKQLIREMVLSDAYQRSVHAPPHARQFDPENRFFSYAHGKRLEAEALRDAMLSISGELTIPGQGSTLKPGIKEDYRYSHTPNLRSVYLPILRNSLPELFEAFDYPNPSVSQGQRSQSTVAPQALVLLNSPWVHSRASQAAERLLADLQLPADHTQISEAGWNDVIERTFIRTIGRLPEESERYSVDQLVSQLRSQSLTNQAIVTRLVHGLFCSLDFRYLD